VVFRYATGAVAVPILNFPGFWIDRIIPGNLLEKVLVNAFFPGGAGGIAGEVLAGNYRGEAVAGRKKYLARLGGALGQTAAWSAFQFFGYFLMIRGPHGGRNLFESVFVFPINFALAALSIFTPDVVNLAKQGIKKIHRKTSRNNRYVTSFPEVLFGAFKVKIASTPKETSCSKPLNRRFQGFQVCVLNHQDKLK
jgi:hypothetical protein